ncbi:hypothetical protein PT974_11215 [Cladobotryum mycophilum]|uniref:GST N-terminal domain-containing protein n=1 Tax=Cladobotryum mycophilum TaxID=491253 RepID=A0ABR0S4L4_9HYPO
MATSEIVLYHYTYSPYARRITWYLALRGIPYKQCLQPGMLPRPDVSRLGMSHRRIPIMSIGRDVYLDSRLQLEKLEEMFPEKPRLGATTAEHKAVERLLSHFIIDAGIFANGVTLLPTNLPMLKDPRYFKDRGDYIGGNLSKESMARARPEATMEFSAAFELLETTLLADGREWILRTKEPSLADIEAVWPFHWLSGIPGALPVEIFSPEKFPKVYAWMKRFQDAVSVAKKKVEKVVTLDGEAAASFIEGSEYHDAEGSVDEADPVVVAQGLKKGDAVVVSPTDTGKAHKDVGKLVSVDGKEVVIEVVTEKKKSVRVHAPRHGFRVKKQGDSAKL